MIRGRNAHIGHRARPRVAPAPVVTTGIPLEQAMERLAVLLDHGRAIEIRDALLAYASEPILGALPEQIAAGAVWQVEGRILYALVRLLRPERVVEIGCYIGVSAAFILAALERNGNGRLTSVDIDQASGSWIEENLRSRWDFVTGRGQDLLAQIPGPISIVFDDASHEAEDTEQILRACIAQDPVIILSHDAEHWIWRDAVHAAHTATFGQCRSMLVAPSECGLAYHVHRQPEHVWLHDNGAPEILVRSPIDVEYVIGSYMGPRSRGGDAYDQDGSWMLREHLRRLVDLDLDLDLVTIVNNDVGDPAEAMLDDLPDTLGRARLRVLRRPNSGYSYGCLVEASRRSSSSRQMILVEDDYVFAYGDAVQWMLERQPPDGGMLVPAAWPWTVIGHEPVQHAALFGGPVRSDVFADAIARGWHGQPVLVEGSSYDVGCSNQVRLSQAIPLAGYSLTDWLDERAFAYFNGERQIDLYTNSENRRALLIPLQAIDQTLQINVMTRPDLDSHRPLVTSFIGILRANGVIEVVQGPEI